MKKKLRKNIITPIVFSCLAILLLFPQCAEKEAQEVPIGTVTKGKFYIDIYEEGEIEAVNSITISSPIISWRYGNLKITELVKDGDEVKKGDTLIVFDQAEVQKAIVDAESRMEISYAELEKMKAQQQSTLEELNADLEVTQLSYEISKMSFEAARHESDMRKKQIELNLEKAEISLQTAKEQIENRKRIQQEERKQKMLSIQRDQERLDESYETLNKLFVTTPSPGIAIITTNYSTNNKYQVGDQCWSGSPLIQLPDLSQLKATVKINEVDISKITKGLKVEIKPDAFSDSIFTGTIHSVANLAVNKNWNSKVKVFPVEILINETNKNLLPGLTVSCRLIIDELEDVLYVPLDAIRTELGKDYVYKKTAGGYDKVEVETGQRNSDYVIIVDGLKENDKIALIDPFYVEGEKAVEVGSETKEGE